MLGLITVVPAVTGGITQLALGDGGLFVAALTEIGIFSIYGASAGQ